MYPKIFFLFVILIILTACTGPEATPEPTPIPQDEPTDTTAPEPEVEATETPVPPTPTEEQEAEEKLQPLEWLRSQPFQPGSEEPATVLAGNLPEGFEIHGLQTVSTNMPPGGKAYVTMLEYQKPEGGQVHTEENVKLQILSYENEETRDVHLDILASEDYQFAFYPLNDTEVVRYHTASVDGRIWVSGPYLIVIYSGLDQSEKGPWVDTFAEKYLESYPLP